MRVSNWQSFDLSPFFGSPSWAHQQLHTHTHNVLPTHSLTMRAACAACRVESSSLWTCFPELRGAVEAAACRFSDCLHVAEPGCSVLEAETEFERYPLYLRCLEEIRVGQWPCHDGQLRSCWDPGMCGHALRACLFTTFLMTGSTDNTGACCDAVLCQAREEHDTKVLQAGKRLREGNAKVRMHGAQ